MVRRRHLQTRAPNIRLKWENLLILLHIPIHLFPPLVQRLWCLPRIFWVPQPQPHQMSLLLLRVCEPIPRMEDAEVVCELYIALLEVERHGVLLGQEV